MLKFFAVIMVAAGLQIGICQAKPPPAGSEQDEVLLPYAGWVKGLENPQTKQGCCDLSDCRVVSARVKFGHYQAFIGQGTYGEDAPDDWLDVPDEVVLHEGGNPVGMPVACWRASRQPLFNGFFCFHDGSAT